jgi:hypothetical protein
MLLSTKITIPNLNLIFDQIYKDILSRQHYSNDPFRIILQYLISLLPLKQAIGYNSREFVSLIYLKENIRDACKALIEAQGLSINKELKELTNEQRECAKIHGKASFYNIIPVKLIGCLGNNCQGSDKIVGNFMLITNRKIPLRIFTLLQKYISAIFLQPSYRMKYLSNDKSHNCIYKNGNKRLWGPLNKAGKFLISE